VSGPVSSFARVPTAAPRRHLAQLCGHFKHMLPVEFDRTQGRIGFGAGACRLDAAEPGVLALRLSADDEAALATLEDVVARHLRRIAFGEAPEVAWTRAG
jgi:uncharacterized protein